MTAIEVSAVSQSSPEVLFSLSQDYSRRLAWDPFLSSCELSAESAAEGVEATVRARNGLRMRSVYTRIRAPELVAMRMVDGPWVFKTFGGSWRFLDAPKGTRVIFRYAFRPRFRWLGWIMKSVLRRQMRRRLAALVAEARRRDSP